MAYVPTEWNDGDLITAEKLNKLEQGVQNEQTGPQGPEGPKGDTGAQGPKGDTGETGPAGKGVKSIAPWNRRRMLRCRRLPLLLLWSAQ